MNLKPLIHDTLMPVAPTAPAKKSQKYGGKATTYITFFEYDKQPEEAADDETTANGRYWQIDLWRLKDDPYTTDLYDIEQQIEKALATTGFGDFTYQDLYEADTETAHYAIRCYFYEEV
jgi:hypothetical protein